MVKKYVAMRYKNNAHAAFSVDWYIGKRCNFDCSYCVDYLHDNVSKHPPYEKLITLVDLLYNRYGSNIHWSITGGEPTIIPWFHDVAKYIYEKPSGVREISITTNGSRTTEYFRTLFPYLHNITMSMHFEHIAHREDEYVEKIIALEKWRKSWNAIQKSYDPEFNKSGEAFARGHRDKTFLARFMVYPGQFERIQRMYDKLEEAGVEKIEFRYIRPLVGKGNEKMPDEKITDGRNHDNDAVTDMRVTGRGDQLGSTTRSDGITNKQAPDYTPIGGNPIDGKSPYTVKIASREEGWYSDGEKTKIKEWYGAPTTKKLNIAYFENDGEVTQEGFHYNQLNYERKNNFEGWTCYAGRSHMKITPSGDVYIGSCHVGGKLGNIYEITDGFVLPQGPVTCPKWRCTDNLDLRCPKARPGYEHLITPYVTEVVGGL